MKLSVALLIGLVALGSPRVADAQNRGTGKDIPASARPPAGMCRIWLNDVPAAQQPAPTDCASAVRNRPAKGRVIFGDDYVKTKPKGDDTSSKGKPAIKGFAPAKSGSKKPPIRIP
jgi:hypothetical protein